MIVRLIARLRGLARRRTIDAELDEELQFHLEHEIAANIARGMAAAEARRIALRDLGGVASTRDAVHDVRTLSLDLVWRAQQDVFTGLAAVNEATFSFKREGGGEPETVRSQMVTAEFFRVLRVTPLIGRPFTAENEVNGRGRVAVISYSLWQRRFGGASDILSKPLRGVLADLEIVGVMPPGFVYPVGASEPT